MTWSWTALLAEAGGDEERALAALSDIEGWGSYSDAVHRPMRVTTIRNERAMNRERKRKQRAAAARRAAP